MNAAYFLTPKSSVSYIYSDCTVRQGLEKMRHTGFSAIPVIHHDGTYAGIVREGDFLWYLLDRENFSLRDLENARLSAVLKPEVIPAERITASIETVIDRAITQNFVPIIDDSNVFIGIVTRMSVMKHLRKTLPKK